MFDLKVFLFGNSLLIYGFYYEIGYEEKPSLI